jgi:hypothetical protein
MKLIAKISTTTGKSKMLHVLYVKDLAEAHARIFKAIQEWPVEDQAHILVAYELKKVG